MKRNKKGRSSRSVKQKTKAAYRICNWSKYNTALVERGSLTVWFEEQVIDQWIATVPTGNRKRGATPHYSDLAITCILTIGLVFQLPLRQQQGLAQSLIRLMNLCLPVPNYTTLCRRRQSLKIEVPVEVPASCALRRKEGVHVVVDSTGLKIYGEGEWKVRQHGAGKRRTWRKLHLAVDEATHEILAAELTLCTTGDSEVLPDLLEQVVQSEVSIDQVSGDGSYDSWACHETIAKHGAQAAIPVRVGSVIRQHGNCKETPLPRDQILRRERAIGRAAWKRESAYHRRSLAETAMFRQKQIFGVGLGSRLWASQQQEAFLRCVALNRMTRLGMPDCVAINKQVFEEVA